MKKEDITFKKFIEEIYLSVVQNSGERKYLQESLLDHSKTLCLFLQEESVRNRSDKCTDPGSSSWQNNSVQTMYALFRECYV